MVLDRGIVPVRPKDFADKHPMPVTRSPEDVEIVVAGGRGGHSGVILPWALHSEQIVLPVTLPNGKVPRASRTSGSKSVMSDCFEILNDKALVAARDAWMEKLSELLPAGTWTAD